MQLQRPVQHLLPGISAALLVALTTVSTGCTPVRWPYNPGNVTYELGNNFGEYQNYGTGPYYHDGLDILGGTTRPLYAVEDGTVTHVTDDGGGLYTGIMIGEPSAGGVGYLYWHIDSSTLAVSVGDVVNDGDYLGDIVFWPTSSFHHVHFSRVRGTGGYPWGWYEAIANPLGYLEPDTDNASPVFQNAGAGAPFLFCRDETSTYLSPTDLDGKVDIVARLTDKFNGGTTWDMIPVSMNLEIRPAGGGAAVLKRHAFFFHGNLGSDATFVTTVYKDDGTANTQGNYNGRDFYFVVTNSDGDLIVEATDQSGAWDTTAVPNGEYEVTVNAWDDDNNKVTANMIVVVSN